MQIIFKSFANYMQIICKVYADYMQIVLACLDYFYNYFQALLTAEGVVAALVTGAILSQVGDPNIRIFAYLLALPQPFQHQRVSSKLNTILFIFQ